MAGHKISGYVSAIWQALFASFIRLFTRFFHFTSSNTTSSAQQPASGENPGSQSPTANTHPSTNTSQPQHKSLDLEKGSHHDEDEDEDEAMAASKKRGGQKRSGVKPNGAHPVVTTAPASQQLGKENVGPGKQTNPASTASDSINKPTPLGSSTQMGKNDTTGNAKQFDGQKPNGPRASGISRGRSSPTRPPTDKTKHDAPAPGRPASKMASSQTPVRTAVAPAENKPEIQKPGSYSHIGTQAPDLAAKAASGKNVPPLIVQVNETAAAIDQLTLDDKDGQVASEKELNKDTAATEAAGVPSVLAVSLLIKQPIVAKPLAPLVTPPSQVLPGLIEPDTEEGKIEREYHLGFMREALGMGSLALSTNETPVGCVLVYRGRTIAKGMNATNVTRNGTRHAEFMALSALLSHQPDADVKDELPLDDKSLWGDVDPSDGHIFPYGQKLHPSPKVNRSIISECVLYVTVEPCVMCASLLRQLGIQKVYFGAVNDKFGGTGGVFRIHINSKPVPKPTGDRPYQNGYGPHDVDRISRGRATTLPREEDDGDGGNVEPGYPAEGGYLRDEAVSLLRRFYVQENGRAPQPRKKEGRAARLFAMENAGNGGSSSDMSDGVALPETPADVGSADQMKFPEPVKESVAAA